MKFEKLCIKLLVDDRDLQDSIKWYNSVNNVFRKNATSSLGYNTSVFKNYKNLGRKTLFEFGHDKPIRKVDNSSYRFSNFVDKLQSSRSMSYLQYDKVRTKVKRNKDGDLK